MEGISMKFYVHCSRTRQSPLRVREMCFSSRHRVLRKVEDAGGQRRVGAAGREDVEEVLEGAGAAGRNHRNRDRGGHRRGELAVEALARAVAIDRRQQDLAGAARSPLRCAHSTASRPVGRAAAARVHVEAAVLPLRVDRDDHRLAAVACRQPGDQRRIGERRAVHADLVGARVDRRLGVVERRMPPPTASGMNSSRDTARIVSASARRASSVAVTSRITSSSIPSTL